MLKGIRFGIGLAIGLGATIIVARSTKINGISILDIVRNAAFGVETDIEIEH